MSKPQSNEQTIREKLHELYSANFNDGEPVGARYGSKDMVHISEVIDFIDDFATPYITRYGLEQEKAGIENYRSDIVQLPHHQATINADDRITEITKQLEAEL